MKQNVNSVFLISYTKRRCERAPEGLNPTGSLRQNYNFEKSD